MITSCTWLSRSPAGGIRRNRAFCSNSRILRVPIRAAGSHGAQGAHTAIALEGASLVKDGLAGTLVGTGEQAPDHDRVGAGRDRLGDVAGELYPSVGNQRHP